jgi:hypothetical protein
MTYQRGDRIVLVLTSDPHTRLLPGTTGTVNSYDTRLGHLAVTWDDGSTLAMLLHDGDQVRPLLRPSLRPETVRSADGSRLIEIISRADRSYAVVLRSAATGQIITDRLPRTARQMISLVRTWAAGDPCSPDLEPPEEDLDPSGGHVPQDITDPVTGCSRLLSERCTTCILAAGDRMHLGPERLRAVIADALAAGIFVVCHDTLTYGNYPGYGPAICRGYYDAYADRSPALTLLRACQRLVEVTPPEAAFPDSAPTGPANAGTLPCIAVAHPVKTDDERVRREQKSPGEPAAQ